MNREKELQKISKEIEHCRECAIGGTGRAVPGEGNPDAALMLIGEAPGREESRTGRPFIGRSGRFLRRVLVCTGIDENEVFITSPVHYLPVSGKLSESAIDHGRIHMLKQVRIIKPRLIVLLGNTACRALLGKKIEIGGKRGTIVEWNGIRCFVSYHPAYAMRFPEAGRKFCQDFTKISLLISEKV